MDPAASRKTLLGQWLGLRQPQVSRFQTDPSIRHLDTLQQWAETLRIPPDLGRSHPALGDDQIRRLP